MARALVVPFPHVPRSLFCIDHTPFRAPIPRAGVSTYCIYDEGSRRGIDTFLVDSAPATTGGVSALAGPPTRRATDPNGCPEGTDLWVPRTRALLERVISRYGFAATRTGVYGRQDGCGDCENSPMNSESLEQARHWTNTALRAGAPERPWFLSSVSRSHLQGDYKRGCWLTPRGVTADGLVVADDVDPETGDCLTAATSYVCSSNAWDAVLAPALPPTVDSARSPPPPLWPPPLSPPPSDPPSPSPPPIPNAPPWPPIAPGGAYLTAGAHLLPRSSPGNLLRVVRSDSASPDFFPAPVARSYDGYDWELVEPAAGAADAPLLECSGDGACTLTVPDESTHSYRYRYVSGGTPSGGRRLQSAGGSADASRSEASRFLTQTTFGPTRETISALAGALDDPATRDGAFRGWIGTQMALPASLHREYWRRRTSPRAIVGGTTFGSTGSPCDFGSRWVRWAFEAADRGRKLIFRETVVAGTFELTTDGVTRHVGANIWLYPRDTWPRVHEGDAVPASPMDGDEYEIRVIDDEAEAVGGWIALRPWDDATAGRFDNDNDYSYFSLENSAISLSTVDPYLTHVFAHADNYTLVAVAPHDLSTTAVLSRYDGECAMSAAAAIDAFLEVEGVHYRHERRVRVVDNTLGSLTSRFDGWASQDFHIDSGRATCPAVPLTFLNAAYCARQPACQPVSYTSTLITLDAATLADFYQVGARHVLRVTNLRLEPPYDTGPCSVAAGYTDLRSRWRKLDGMASCPDAAWSSASDRLAVREALEAASGETVRDAYSVSCDASTAAGIKISASGSCWEHVHPDEHSVIDFSTWAAQHPGGADNIHKWAAAGLSDLTYPSLHGMDRFYTARASTGGLPVLGRWGESVDFVELPAAVQTAAMAEYFGAIVSEGEEQVEACGSPGETGNVAALGHRYKAWISETDDGSRGLDAAYTSENGKSMVHTMLALNAPDQLRQRVAWALSQTWVVGEVGLQSYASENEIWHAYYDIFVRHAFGNLFDVMREVSFSPAMGIFLTLVDATAISVDGSVPDENYAREIMQLFTIGLFELKMDGTRERDASGAHIPTYSTEQILSFARAWTGLTRQSPRTNIERVSKGGPAQNNVDPMRFVPTWRDPLPKMDLHHGYIGDHTPLCADLPLRPFLRRRLGYYRYLGHDPAPQFHYDPESYASYRSSADNTFALDAASPLRAALCAADAEGVCTWPSEVTLNDTLPCHSTECEVDTLRVARIEATSETVFYEYVRSPCVYPAFSNDARAIETLGGGVWPVTEPSNEPNAPAWPRQLGADRICVPTDAAAAAAFCCFAGGPPSVTCAYLGERLSLSSAEARCALRGGSLCDAPRASFDGYRPDYGDRACGAVEIHAWSAIPCTMQLQVHATGEVSMVIPESKMPSVSLGSGHRFRVRWSNGRYPRASDDCAAEAGEAWVPSCHRDANSCVCDVSVRDVTVFDEIPSREQIEASLFSGSVPLESYDESAYRLVDGGGGLPLSAGGVEAYVATDTYDGSSLESSTIFKILVNGTYPRYLFNKASTVAISTRGGGAADGDGYTFRNPPQFMNHADPAARDAKHETDWVLNHLFWHKNTAPFTAHKLIQRLVSSNPSPAYVSAVAAAFSEGSYAGIGSGRYGDLSAMVAATLLHREARALTLDEDGGHGGQREPLLMLLHLMRALEYTPNEATEVELHQLEQKIGQAHFQVWAQP